MTWKLAIVLSILTSCVLAETFLTPREEQLMKESLQLLVKELPIHAMNIFIEMFTARPDFRTLFQNVDQNIPLYKLREDPFLKQHANKILLTLLTAIADLMNEPAALYSKFKEVAEQHIPRKVDHTNLVVFKDMVLKYLKSALYNSVDPVDLNDVLAAWEKILNKAYDAFYEVNNGKGNELSNNNSSNELTDEYLNKEHIALIFSGLPTNSMNLIIEMATERPDFKDIAKKVSEGTSIEQLKNDPIFKQLSLKDLQTLSAVISELMKDPAKMQNTLVVPDIKSNLPMMIDNYKLGNNIEENIPTTVPATPRGPMLSGLNPQQIMNNVMGINRNVNKKRIS